MVITLEEQCYPLKVVCAVMCNFLFDGTSVSKLTDELIITYFCMQGGLFAFAHHRDIPRGSSSIC